MIATLLVLAAALSAASAPKAEVRSVRLTPSKLIVSREKAGSDVLVTGQIRVDMSFARNTVRKPVLRLACLCEANGVLSVNTILLDRPRTCEGMRRSEVMNAFKAAGVDIPSKDRERAYSDPAMFTPFLPEVTKDAYAAAVYGSADVKRGFFRLGRSETMPKVLLFRLELWQNGVLAASYDSSRTGLGKYEIPADWHVWKKYPQKFKYADVH